MKIQEALKLTQDDSNTIMLIKQKLDESYTFIYAWPIFNSTRYKIIEIRKEIEDKNK